MTALSGIAVAIHGAISAARSPAELEAAGRGIWRQLEATRISWDEAALLQDAVIARRPLRGERTLGGATEAVAGKLRRRLGASAIPPARPSPRSPDREASRARRRKWGGAGRMPPQLRSLYTEGERAALSVIADWITRHGACALPIAAIAARAGVCRTTVQNALRAARRLGHMRVTERPRRGLKSLTNIVRIASAEWLTWLRLAGSAPGGVGRTGFKTATAMGATEKKVNKKRGGGRPPGGVSSASKRRRGASGGAERS